MCLSTIITQFIDDKEMIYEKCNLWKIVSNKIQNVKNNI